MRGEEFVGQGSIREELGWREEDPKG